MTSLYTDNFEVSYYILRNENLVKDQILKRELKPLVKYKKSLKISQSKKKTQGLMVSPQNSTQLSKKN